MSNKNICYMCGSEDIDLKYNKTKAFCWNCHNLVNKKECILTTEQLIHFRIKKKIEEAEYNEQINSTTRDILEELLSLIKK